MNTLFNYFLAMVIGALGFYFLAPQHEYGINLINQNTIELKSVQSGNVWVTSPDSITYFLEVDNI